MPFLFKSLNFLGLMLIEAKTYSDNRGYFKELYKYSDFKGNQILPNFVQDNYSISSKGVLRGLHYQHLPKAQGKLVQVFKGRIWDVAVDIRKNSPTFMQWFGVELSEQNHKMLYLPPGFAHGFLALEDNTAVLYKCTQEYSPELEAGIIWDDPEINVQWPLKEVTLSQKDLQLPLFKDAKIFNFEEDL